jgi:glyoxylase-like metal-dependent hydrolase (beta-lactamase superfamily II)/8-oxo-dGTP pyrophosphatase MutT (NUDIX family)
MNMAEPKDAAAVVLTDGQTGICWARRSLKLNFLGGWHAFPGGKLEKSDADNIVKNCNDSELAALITCAARECFEETGVLLNRGGEKLTKGQRTSLHNDLISGRFTFAEILQHWDLWLDAEDFTFIGAWTTPPFSPVRFKTRFFLAVCPPKQKPLAASEELEIVEFIEAANALQKWRRGEILCAPPILNTLRVFSEFKVQNAQFKVKKLLQLADAEGAHPRKIEFNPHITVFPVRTLTLPPATHTNCFIVGRQEFIVVDAASTVAEEQTVLHEFVDEIIKSGGTCQGIIVSHFHLDHTGGETALQKHLQAKHNQRVPLAAHRLTAERLPNVKFERFLENDEIFNLKDAKGNEFALKTLHAPGHARGHLCFYEERTGFLLSSDNVVGTGSVLIAPPEGNMIDYLNSLRSLKDLPNLRFLCGSHGAAIANAREKIESYLAHRLEREHKILDAWNAGAKTTSEIVRQVYIDIKPELWQLAEKSVEAHLEKLQFENKI